MSTEENTPEQATDELALLKERAKLLNIGFSNNISVDTLRQRITDKLEGMNTKEEKPKDEVNALTGGNSTTTTPALRAYIYKENMRMLRLRITNLDPKKREIPGEFISAGNKYLGTVRKYIPYGEQTDGGYHVPYCIYKALKRKKFQDIRVTKKDGRESVTSRWVSEYAIEVLPPLTKKEMAELAKAQQAAGSID